MGLAQGSFTRDYANTAGAERDGCWPTFHLMAEPIEVEGQVVYRDVEMVKIFMPGNPGTIPDIPVTDVERKRWPDAYKAFKENLEAPLDGIPLEEWNILTPAMLETLKSLKFRTIEDIAGMSEIGVQKINPGGRQLKLKAVAYLDQAERSQIVNKALSDAEKFERRCAEQDTQIARLNDLLHQQSEQITRLTTQADFDQRNISSTPQRPMVQPQPDYQQQVVSPFAAFAVFAESEPPQASDTPVGEHLTVAPPQPKRGRPSRADIVAREGTNG